MTSFAQGTEVPVQRTRAHLEQLLRAHGAEGFAFGWTNEADRIEFVWKGSRVRFTLGRPPREKFLLTRTGLQRSETQIQRAMDEEDRRRWRALVLVVRAKLEAVESWISIFEEEFLAFIVMPNERTVGEILVPQLSDGTIVRKLLPPSQQPQ